VKSERGKKQHFQQQTIFILNHSQMLTGERLQATVYKEETHMFFHAILLAVFSCNRS
jgi:ribosomal protein L14